MAYARQLEAISKVSKMITSSLYLEEILKLIVTVTAEVAVKSRSISGKGWVVIPGKLSRTVPKPTIPSRPRISRKATGIRLWAVESRWPEKRAGGPGRFPVDCDAPLLQEAEGSDIPGWTDDQELVSG